MIKFSMKPMFIIILTLSLVLAAVLLSPSTPFQSVSLDSSPTGKPDIWSVRRLVERRPCKWWLLGHLAPLPAESNGYIRVDCYGGLNQMRRDLCDGVGVARLLNATLVLPSLKWLHIGMNQDVFDVDYFVQQMNGYIKVVKELPPEISPRNPFM